MRVAGTRNAIASALTDMPSGARNSSLSTSPGWVVTRLGVDDLDISRILRGPNETDAPSRGESVYATIATRQLRYPHPQPLPTRGRGADRVRGQSAAARGSIRDGAPVPLQMLRGAP